MRWEIEQTGEFEDWWTTLTVAERRLVGASLRPLRESGPRTGRPFVDSVWGSKHSNLKELRSTPTIRVFFAFDPRRVAILLVGGDKAGKTKRFYRQMIARADQIYDLHLSRVAKEGLENEKG